MIASSTPMSAAFFLVIRKVADETLFEINID